MNWEQLSYFRVTARREHMGRAAEELGVSQSTLSRSIARLEEHYGVLLFDRVKRGLRLNGFGAALLQRVERALLELEDGERELHDMANRSDRQVALGFFGSLGTRLVPELIVSFRKQFPEADFRLLQGDFALLRDRLMSREIDLGLACRPNAEYELEWQPLWNEELIALVPHDHPHADKSEVDLSVLERDPMVALREGVPLREDFDRLTRDAGFVPRIAFEGSEVATLVGLVGAGFGVSLIPRNVAETQDRAKALRIRKPKCFRTIGLSWLKDRYVTNVVRVFRAFASSYRPEVFLIQP